MQETSLQQPGAIKDEAHSCVLLYFWAFGDLHYRARTKWKALHTPRMTLMFDDLHEIWQEQGKPAFCVSPGDIVNNGSLENYALARAELKMHLGDMPFYPGLGNHEFLPDREEDHLPGEDEFQVAWGKPVRYTWTEGDIVCIMLDHPSPFYPGGREPNPHVFFSEQSLAFLDDVLEKYANKRTIIFAHCPLRDTVLDRDPQRNLDYDSQDTFFFVENSNEVRSILAKRRNASLYICGHTHSGWGSPQLIFTELAGEHPITHINLMSPWYTGRNHGPYRDAAGKLCYKPDDPDIVASFAIRVFPAQTNIRLRDHRTKVWLDQWNVPF
jgi:3',5'-cyclic AMP phosphodiesterase CpdA